MDNFNISDELPFASLNNDASILPNSNSHELEFQPFVIDDHKYSKDLDVDSFYTKYGLDTIPKTNYGYLDDFPVVNRNCLTICNFNIRSIPTNLQYFKDIFYK